MAGSPVQVRPHAGNAACLLTKPLAGWLSCWQCCGSTHIFENPLSAFGVWALLHASLGKAGISLSFLILPASLTGSLRQWGKRAAALPLKWGQPKAARLLDNRQAACGENQFNQRFAFAAQRGPRAALAKSAGAHLPRPQQERERHALLRLAPRAQQEAGGVRLLHKHVHRPAAAALPDQAGLQAVPHLSLQRRQAAEVQGAAG